MSHAALGYAVLSALKSVVSSYTRGMLIHGNTVHVASGLRVLRVAVHLVPSGGQQQTQTHTVPCLHAIYATHYTIICSHCALLLLCGVWGVALCC